MTAIRLPLSFSGLRFSWAATGLYSLTTVIAFVSAFPGRTIALGTLLPLAVALAVAIAVLIHALDFASRSLVPDVLRQRASWFLLLVTVVGLARGVGFYVLVDWAGLPQPTPLPVRLLSSTITTLIWLTASCALIDATTNYSRQFTRLFNQTAMAVALDRGGQATGDVSIDSLDNLVALKRNLSGILEQASARGISSDALVAAGAAVREQIEQVIRPLSHRLWFNGRRNRTEIRMSGLLGDAVTQFSFSTSRVLAIWGALAFASILNEYPATRVVFGVALSLGLLYLPIAAYRRFSPASLQRLGTKLSIPFIIFLAVVPVSCADLLMPLFGFERMLFPVSAATIVSPIVIVVLLVADSSIALVEQDRRLVGQLFDGRIHGKASEHQDAFASYLHNSLQSELSGIAYRLEASAADPNSMESRETLERLGALINRSISEDFANFEETPLLRLDRMIEAWDGIAAVTVTIDDACKADSQVLNRIVQVIEEATTNSVRHGKARHLHAEVRKTSTGSRIEITTDASEPPKAASGLGEDWLRQHAISVTPLEFTEKSTRFTVEI